MDKHEQAKQDYIDGMKYKDIAAKYDVSLNTVKSWKKRHGWERGAPKEKSVHPKTEKVAPKIIDVNNNELSIKQQKFADEYVKSGNASEAIILAGYSDSSTTNTTKLLKNTKVKAYIDGLRNEMSSKTIADANEVLEFYTRVIRGEEQETVVVATKFDIEEVDKTPDLKTRLAAAKELIKRYPGNDRLQDAQFRKLDAEARIVGNKADKLTNNSQDNDLLSALSDVINGGDDSNETEVQSETDGEH